MLAIDESRQLLVAELIEHSAQIDELVVKSRQANPDMATEYHQKLEWLRARQKEITQQLHASEVFNDSAWENIGDGG